MILKSCRNRQREVAIGYFGVDCAGAAPAQVPGCWRPDRHWRWDRCCPRRLLRTLKQRRAPDEAVHVAVATSLAAILPAAIVRRPGASAGGEHRLAFLRDWGPGIATGVVAAQVAAPHVRGSFMTAIFALLCLIFAVRFAFPTAISAAGRTTARWRVSAFGGRQHRAPLGCRDRRRHSDEYCDDAPRTADAQAPVEQPQQASR